MGSLFETGVRPLMDEYIRKKSEEQRDYGDYWSASSAGYCMRLNILRRLRIPKVPEMADDDMRTQRVFECGHVFHEWAQRITKNAGLSVAQELELQDEGLMVRGHIDDLVLVKKLDSVPGGDWEFQEKDHLILYDYKTANSQAFNYKKNRGIGHYHSMQLATYMYMLRKVQSITGTLTNIPEHPDVKGAKARLDITYMNLTEARILTISKDDLRMHEAQLIWSDIWEEKVTTYWKTLQSHWDRKTLPPCTCLQHDGGFLGKRSSKGKVYNDYFLDGVPCSEAWVRDKLPEGWRC